MTRTQVDAQTLDLVEDWILDQLLARYPSKAVDVGFHRQDENWLYWAVAVPSAGGVFDRMPLLRELEQKWEMEHPKSEWKLFLIPAAEKLKSA